jgi:hypothetical protein
VSGDASEKLILRKRLDRGLARIALLLFKRAECNIRGIWCLGKEADDAVASNTELNEHHFLCGEKGKIASNYHPAFNLRKFTDLVKMISSENPFAKTSCKTTNDKVFTSLTSLGRVEERMLVYATYEPYFRSLIYLTGMKITSLAPFFKALESSERFRILFSLDYSVLCEDPRYLSITPDISRMSGNKTSVRYSKAKVCLNSLIKDKSC